MIAVSQAVLELQDRKKKVHRRRVRFRRSFFDIELQKYVLEETPTEVRKSEVKSISTARESLDRKGINRFESGNITIELENRNNKWSKFNKDGFLAADNVAKLGYRVEFMEMVVDLFYELADGTESAPIPIFTGRVLRPDFNPDRDTVSFVVESRAIVLKLANAENVSDQKFNQLLIGTVDGINKIFTSPDTGVGIVDEVRLSNIPLRLGADVKVTDLADPDIGATFTFTTPPPIGSDPRADYKVWKKGEFIEDLVGLLADEAGILLSERDIQPVVFPNQVLNKEIFTEKVDWDTGIFIGTESISQPGDIILQGVNSPGSLFDDFSDGDFTANPTWTVEQATWAIAGFTLSDMLTSTQASATSGIISVPSTQNKGTWEFTHSYNDPGLTNTVPAQNTARDGIRFNFVFDTATGDTYVFRIFASGNLTVFRLEKIQATVTTVLATTSIPRDNYPRSTNAVWRITVEHSDPTTATIKLYRDGNPTEVLTAVDVARVDVVDVMKLEAGRRVGFEIQFFGQNFFDRFKLVPNTVIPAGIDFIGTGTWESPVIDTGPGNPLSYGLLDRIQILPPGTTILYETATSDDGLAFPDGFVPITAGGLIASVVRRFIKVRITMTPDGANATTPIVNEIAVNFTTSSIGIVLANFLNLTVFQAITELAKIANFEWGFSRAGRLFFRQRTFSTTPVLVIELENLKSFSKITNGAERVRNFIRAAYGSHTKITSPDTRGDAKPNSFDDHLFKPLSVGSTKLLLDPDADIATGLSLSYFEEFKNERPGFQLSIDLRPQLELADTVLLRIRDAVPSPPWHIGDSSRAIGDKDIHLYGERQQAAYEILARILSIRNNTDNMQSSLDLERI